MSRKPDPHSAIGKIRQYFNANPEEELTYSDMAIKFLITQSQAQRAVEALSKHGIVKRTNVTFVSRADL